MALALFLEFDPLSALLLGRGIKFQQLQRGVHTVSKTPIGLLPQWAAGRKHTECQCTELESNSSEHFMTVSRIGDSGWLGAILARRLGDQAGTLFIGQNTDEDGMGQISLVPVAFPKIEQNSLHIKLQPGGRATPLAGDDHVHQPTIPYLSSVVQHGGKLFLHKSAALSFVRLDP